MAKVEHHLGELFPRVGFLVTNMMLPSRSLVRFYNKRGTAEQWIKEGKHATCWTRLSCHRFRANEVRLQLAVLAYNLGNLWRLLGLPSRVKSSSLTSLQHRLMKTGGRLVKHARYYWLLLAEGHLNRRLSGEMLGRLEALPVPEGNATSLRGAGAQTGGRPGRRSVAEATLHGPEGGRGAVVGGPRAAKQRRNGAHMTGTAEKRCSAGAVPLSYSCPEGQNGNPGEEPEEKKAEVQQPNRTTPKPIRYDPADPESIRAIQFVDVTTGEPQVWYARTFDGKYDLFDNEGFHPVEFVKLQPITQSVVQDMLRRAQEEQHKREQAKKALAQEEQSREQAPPQEPAQQLREEHAVAQATRDPSPNEIRAPVQQVSQAESKPVPPATPTPAKSVPAKRAGPPRLIVLAGDESGNDWTTNITAELERAFVLSSKIRPLLRSEVPAEVMRKLSDIPLHDLPRLAEEATKAGARYLAIGRCLELEERVVFALSNLKPISWNAVVRIQVLDTDTGEIVATQGFNNKYGPIHKLDGKTAYDELIKRFASEVVRKVEAQIMASPTYQ